MPKACRIVPAQVMAGGCTSYRPRPALRLRAPSRSWATTAARGVFRALTRGSPLLILRQGFSSELGQAEVQRHWWPQGEMSFVGVIPTSGPSPLRARLRRSRSEVSGTTTAAVSWRPGWIAEVVEPTRSEARVSPHGAWRGGGGFFSVCPLPLDLKAVGFAVVHGRTH